MNGNGLFKSIVEHRQKTYVCPEHGPYLGTECWINTGTQQFHSVSADRSQCPECAKKPLTEKEIARRQQQEELLARQAEEEARLREEALREGFYHEMHMPTDYWGVSFAQIKEHHASIAKAKKEAMIFVENYPTLRRKGAGFCFFGQVGTGKTMLSMAICNELYTRYRNTVSMRYIEMWRIFQLEKQSWETRDRSEFNRLMAVDLLVIDEIGVQFSTKFEESILMELLNERVSEKRNTVYISNLNPNSREGNDSIRSVLGERVYERLRMNTIFLPFGRSQRTPLTSMTSLLENNGNQTK